MMTADAFERSGWRPLRRVLGGISCAWAERREIAVVATGRRDNGTRVTRSVRGVVLIRDGSPVEIPFTIGRSVKVGQPRPAPAGLSLDTIEDTVLPLLARSSRPERAAPRVPGPAAPRTVSTSPGAATAAGLQTTVLQQRVGRYWLWQGETFTEDEEIWHLTDLYDTDERSRLWRQRIAAGMVSAATLSQVADSSWAASRVEFVNEPGWRPPVTLRFTGQAAATLAHELLGHYVENQLQAPAGSIRLPRARITYHPMLAGAITRRAVDDLAVPTSAHVADGAAPSAAPSAVAFMSLRTGSAVRPEPWMGNMAIECGARACPDHHQDQDEAVTVTDVESAFFRRGARTIDLDIRSWKQGDSRDQAAREPVRLSFDVESVLDSLHVEHGPADLHHGVCRKGGLLNAYSIRTPPVVITLPAASRENVRRYS